MKLDEAEVRLLLEAVLYQAERAEHIGENPFAYTRLAQRLRDELAQQGERVKMPRKKWRELARTIANINRHEGKIQAIKSLRRETECGLIEAKHAVERLEQVDWNKV